MLMLHSSDPTSRSVRSGAIDHHERADAEQDAGAEHERLAAAELVGEEATEEHAGDGAEDADAAHGRHGPADVVDRNVEALGEEERRVAGVERQAEEEQESPEPVPRVVGVLLRVEHVLRRDDLRRRGELEGEAAAVRHPCSRARRRAAPEGGRPRRGPGRAGTAGPQLCRRRWSRRRARPWSRSR